MFRNTFLDKESTGVILIDVQERLFPLVEHSCEVEHTMVKAVKGFKILKLPFIVSEQYPEKMGGTIPSLKELTKEDTPFAKTAFSCFKDPKLKEALEKHPAKTWILLGIEAHVCVFQTAKDLLLLGKNCVVLNDAISSRSVYDYSTAIAEMRDIGVRITSTETALFELLQNSKVPEFKSISQLIK